MSTARVLTIASVVSMLFAPVAFAGGQAADDMAAIRMEARDLDTVLTSNHMALLRAEARDLSVALASGDMTALRAEARDLRTALESMVLAEVGVPGEKLDSGLGGLPATYTAAEYQRRVAGEKLDSGLGDLLSSYAAEEYQAAAYLFARM